METATTRQESIRLGNAGRPGARAAGLLVATAVLAGLASCKSSEKPAPEQYIVLYAGASATVQRPSGPVELKTGDRLESPDLIQTSNANVDLQSRSGAVLRIRKFTKVRLGSVGTASGRGLHLENGSVLAKLEKRSKAEEFQVTTPTSIASVRGTTFSVAVDEGKQPVVRVQEGAVSMSARAKLASAQGETFVSGKEQLLVGGDEGRLSAAMEKELINMSKVLSQAVANPEEQKQLEQKLRTKLAVAEVEKENRPISTRERAEATTLVTVDDETIQRILAGPVEEARQKLKKQYEEKLDTALSVVEKQVESKSFKSRAELLEHYRVLEIVVTTDGKSRQGAVVAQAGDTLIFHGTEGVSRLRTPDVNYIEYVQK